MALTPCKECGANIYVDVEVCPRCGVKKPGVSYEEERLLNEIQQAKADESRYADAYREHGGGVLKEMINHKIIDKNVQLANEAQQRARSLEAELEKLHKKKYP